jgi:hypothetical protein
MGDTRDNTVFMEVQAALLNSDCDPNEAGMQGLCALYTFVATELDGSSLADALAETLTKVRAQRRLPTEHRKELRNRVLSRQDEARRARR